ncbi:MAG: class I SAM-dependent methyltransferase [Pseudomonadota bacterium]
MQTTNRENILRTRACPECYLCGSQGKLLYQDLSDRLFGVPGNWCFSQCSNAECGLVWLNPKPLEADIGMAYQNYYTHHDNAKLEPLLFRIIAAVLGRMSGYHRHARRVHFMTLDHQAPGKLLEIGCGSGHFLAKMKACGWVVEGVDFDPRAVDYARTTYDIKVHHGTVENAGYPDSAFDAVVMNHVIEHVFDPIALLQETRRLLKPGGKVVVVTPNMASMGHQRFGQVWRGLEPPRHLHLFSRRTLLECAKRAGFERYQVWTTAANVRPIWAGSIDIEETGKHVVGAGLGWLRRLRLLKAQYQEYWALPKQPDAGEEVVLVGESL